MTPQRWLALWSRNSQVSCQARKRRSRRPQLETLEGRQMLATFVVNTFADTVDANLADGVALDANGFTSLRAAVMQANASAGADVIELAAGNYSLTRTAPNENGAVSGDLDVRDDLTIIGAGSGVTIIDASAVNDRIFEVLAAFISRPSTQFAMSGVTLTGGVTNHLDQTAFRGGGMKLDASTHVTLTDCFFVNNRAPTGGAPFFRKGSGGAISTDGNLTIDQCRFENNTATEFGGAIHVNGSGATTIRNTTFVGNSAWFGGAIRMSRRVTVENSTFVGNVATNGSTGQGGAIENFGATLTMTNVTVSGNSSVSGGGVFSSSAAITRLNHCTVAFNTATYGGGLHSNSGTGEVSLENSIVALNSASNGPDILLGVTSLGYNVIGDTTGTSGLGATGDVLNVNPMLGSLQDNGGFTHTHALLGGSPALDAANPNSTLATDQRGMARPKDADGDVIFRSDVGAYEFQADWPPIAVIGGPYSVLEGGSVTLDASGSSSRQLDGALTFEWDLDNDGLFDDATGATASFSAADLDGPATFSVAVRVTDSLGQASGAATTVTVANATPTIDSLTVTPPAVVTAGSPVSLSTVFGDAGLLDTHTVTIDWGDGTVVSAFVNQASGGGSAADTHAYDTAGVYTILVTVTDDDGQSVTQSYQMEVTGGELLVDGVLRLVGTQNSDRVAIQRLDDGSLFVSAEFLPGGTAQFAPGAVQAIIVHLSGGDDSLLVHRNVNISVIADGGEGNDRLVGGGVRDILIGGLGADALDGNNGDDILIGGTTGFDASDDALLALLEEWNSSRTYDLRVSNIRNGAGEFLSGKDIRLWHTTTVLNDGEVDRLVGGAGRDWFFAEPNKDTVADRKRNEQRNNGDAESAKTTKKTKPAKKGKKK